ncbi:MAG: cation:proton antiporter, partial [Cyanobacteria bacterium P01_H01_bin.130]
LVGFGAKALVSKSFLPWQAIALNASAVGTAILLAKFLFLPHTNTITAPEKIQTLAPPMVVLIGGLVLANGVYLEAYSLDSMLKAIATIAAGWLIYWVAIRRISLTLPRLFEQLEHLVGAMSLSAIALLLLLLFAIPAGGLG